jgi:hypothetical protein
MAIAALMRAQPLKRALRFVPSPTSRNPIRVAIAAKAAMAKPRLNELEIF